VYLECLDVISNNSQIILNLNHNQSINLKSMLVKFFSIFFYKFNCQNK
jgi:hypothetical protein